MRFDSKLRLNADADVIHDARVAVRRMRSNLRAFLPVLDSGRARELRERLRWLQDGLSEARDMDVFLALTCRLGESLPDADRRTIDNVRQPFDDARQAAYERFGIMLREERYVALLRDLVDAAKNPPLNDFAGQAASEVIPVLVAGSWSTLRKRVRRHTDQPADRKLHAIRIAAKRVRYLAEAIAAVAGKAARRLAASAEHMQMALGDEHDAMVACEKLREAAADRDCAFVTGELVGVANLAALEARSAWQKPWRDAKRCRRKFK